MKVSANCLPRLLQNFASCLAWAVFAWPLESVARADDTAAKPSVEQIEFFEKKIRPVLVEHCYKCHSADAKEVKGGLRLDSRNALRRGGDSGPVVVPGEPGESLLVEALKFEDLKMPPTGKLPDEVIASFEAWVKQGAIDPRDASVPMTSAKKIDIAAAKQFWAFQPPRAHESPDVAAKAWPKRKIDGFVVAKLEQAGLTPSPPTDRRTWIRRVTFDLIGLPPTPDEVESFLQDESPSADERVVERLLASQHYGERWARVWLDIARYAEDQAHIVGNDASLTYPNAYLYRDWVIAALNSDVPYDTFVKLQLAADLIQPEDAASHAALGFLGLGPKYYQRRSKAVMADEWEDRVDVVMRGLQGLTVACARCHDHKFDPIETADYYALAGVFASTEMFNRPLDDKREVKDGQAKEPKDAIHIVREGTATDLNVFVRGNVENKGSVVPRRFLQVLCAGEPQPFQTGSGRRELAEAIAARENPLTARVIVNRVWGQFFGRPLVATASNFGELGERPTHPELLDDLAVRFMDSGWSLKWLAHELTLSATYRQSSQPEPAGIAADPDNLLLSHIPRRRLSIEAWRDSLLTAAGSLDSTVGGPSINPNDVEQRRRTVYSRIERLELNRLLAMFDFPDPNVHADRRVETTTPLQKMFVLNSPFMVQQATALAERLQADVPADAADADRRRIDLAHRWLFGRPASEAEISLGLTYVNQTDDRAARWREYAHVLLASNEMLFID